nr:hypothetical protein [Tanacetum cinerariifolium]
MASALICLSSGQRFNFSKYIFESLVLNVDNSSKFYMYPRFIQLIIQTNIADLSKHTTRYISLVLTQKVFTNMRRVGKGFSWVETSLFKNMLAVRDIAEEAEAQVPAQGDDVQERAAEEVAPHQPPCPPQPQDAEGSSLLFQRVLDTCSALVLRVEGLDNDKAAQQLEIVKLKARVKKLEKISKVKSFKLRRLKNVGTSQRVESSDDVENVFNQGRMIVDIDQDKGIELVVDQEKDAEVEGRYADKQAEIYNIDLDHSSKVLSMQEDDTEVQEAVEIITTAKLMTEVVTAAATQVVAASTPIPAAKPKTLTITAAPAETAEKINKEHEEAYKNIDWNAALNHVQSKEPQYIKRYHGIKKKPETESEACKNMIFYLKNTEGYKMKFFKGKTYGEILPIFQAKFDANMKFLFKSREEMEAEDEEIIKSINETPAQKAAKRRKLTTPLAQKVPVVDYQVVVIDNKPKYKIIRADDTHQFYISFTTLLKNFDREDLETLWKIVRDKFSTSKPTNFLDEYLLLTLMTMFEEPDGQDAIWRNHKSVHGVNTPRSDEDRIKLMELMVFLLKKGVCDEIGLNAARLSKLLLSGKYAAEGFEQIIDFLSGSYIYYALTVSPHIYISCIKQFWNSVSVKRSGDVTRLQALVDKKKIVISEAVIQEILQLNDAEGVSMEVLDSYYSSIFKRQKTSWNKFSTSMASAVICLSKGQKFNFSKYIFDSLVHNVDSSSKFYMVGKGFSGVETPLFEGMIVERHPAEEELGAKQVQVDAAVAAAVVEDVAEDVVHMATPSPPPHGISSPPSRTIFTSSPTTLVEGLENDKAAQQLEIVKLKARVKKLEKINMVKSSKLRRLKKVGTSQRVESLDDMENVFNQGRIIVDMDQDEGIELVADQEKDAEVEGRHADKQVELYNLDQDHSSKVLSMQEDDTEVVAASTPIPAAKPKILNIAAAPAELPSDTPAETPKVNDKGKGILIEAPKPIKKKDQIEMDAEYARKPQEEINKEHEEAYKNIDWNAALDHVQSKEPQYIKRYHEMKKKLQTESKSREEMEAKDQEIIKSINETPAQKAAKRRKLSEEAQEAKDLRKRLEIVQDDDDDTMFEEPDGQDAIWRNQKSVHGLALVRRWKLLTSCGVHVITLSTVQLFLLVERRGKWDVFRATQVYKTATPRISTRMMVEHILHEAKDQASRTKMKTQCLTSESKDCQSNIDAARLKLKLFKNITAAEDITK